MLVASAEKFPLRIAIFLGEWLHEAVFGSTGSPPPPPIKHLAEAKGALNGLKETPCYLPEDRDSPVDTASPVPPVFINYGLSLLNLDAHYDPFKHGDGGVYGEQWDAMLQRFRTGLDGALPGRVLSTSSTSSTNLSTTGTACLGYRVRKQDEN